MVRAARSSYNACDLRCHESTAVPVQPPVWARLGFFNTSNACFVVRLESRSWHNTSHIDSTFIETLCFFLIATCPGKFSSCWRPSPDLRLAEGNQEVSWWGMYQSITKTSKTAAMKWTRAFCTRRKEEPDTESADHGWVPAERFFFSTENTNLTSSCNETAEFSPLKRGSDKSLFSYMSFHSLLHATKLVLCLSESISSRPVTCPPGNTVRDNMSSTGTSWAICNVEETLLQRAGNHWRTKFRIEGVLDSLRVKYKKEKIDLVVAAFSRSATSGKSFRLVWQKNSWSHTSDAPTPCVKNWIHLCNFLFSPWNLNRSYMKSKDHHNCWLWSSAVVRKATFDKRLESSSRLKRWACWCSSMETTRQHPINIGQRSKLGLKYLPAM